MSSCPRQNMRQSGKFETVSRSVLWSLRMCTSLCAVTANLRAANRMNSYLYMFMVCRQNSVYILGVNHLPEARLCSDTCDILLVILVQVEASNTTLASLYSPFGCIRSSYIYTRLHPPFTGYRRSERTANSANPRIVSIDVRITVAHTAEQRTKQYARQGAGP